MEGDKHKTRPPDLSYSAVNSLTKRSQSKAEGKANTVWGLQRMSLEKKSREPFVKRTLRKASVYVND